MNKDEIRIVDYLRYLREFSIPRHQSARNQAELRFLHDKEEYENRFFPKLFRWKYENSFYFEGSYTAYYDNEIRERLQEIDRCIYQNKMDKEFIVPNLRIYKYFYEWCSVNNIPC